MDPIKEALPYQPELDPIDWRTSMRRARNAFARHIPLIVMSVIASLVLMFAYIKLFPPIYRGEATLQAEPDGDTNRNEYYSLWNLFRKADVKSEPEILMSGRVAAQVVDALGLKFKDVHHTPLTQIAYLWTESWPGKGWRAFKEWLWPPGPDDYKPTPEQIERARTIDSFRDGLRVDVIPGTNVARVTVLAPSFRAAQIANKAIEIFLEERVRIFHGEAERAYEALQAEVARTAKQLADLDREKLEFDTRNHVVLDFEKDKLLVADWAKLQSQMADMKSTIAGIQASLDEIDRQIAVEPPEIVSARTIQDSKLKATLQAREGELAASLVQMREFYRPDSTDVRQVERQLADIRAKLAAEPDKVVVAQQAIVNPVYTELKQRRQSLRAQLASQQATYEAKRVPLAKLERRMDEYPEMVKHITERGRVREGLEARYKLLRDRLMMAEVSRTAVLSAPSSIRVIDWAQPPMRPSWPKMPILLPSAIALGILLGFGLALLAELFSSRVNRDRLLSRPEYPVYAVINMRPALAPGNLAGLPSPEPANDSAIARLRGPG